MLWLNESDKDENVNVFLFDLILNRSSVLDFSFMNSTNRFFKFCFIICYNNVLYFRQKKWSQFAWLIRRFYLCFIEMNECQIEKAVIPSRQFWINRTFDNRTIFSGKSELWSLVCIIIIVFGFVLFDSLELLTEFIHWKLLSKRTSYQSCTQISLRLCRLIAW